MIAPSTGPAHVVIAGGGLAGVEAALALDAFTAGDVRLSVVDPGSRFRVPGTATGRVFGIGSGIDLRLADVVARAGAELVGGTLERVDALRHMAVLAGGRVLSYDALVVAVGARPAAAVPGALTFCGAEDAVAARGMIDEMADRAVRGGLIELAIVVPPGCGWPLAAYELALMAREHLTGRGSAGVGITIVTSEEAPLEIFGERASAAVAAMLARASVGVHPGADVRRWDCGRLILADGSKIWADRAIALPVHRGPRVGGLPADPDGFVAAAPDGAVPGHPDVWAVGDGTSAPVKQGGIACRQADRVAAAIAGALGATVDLPGQPPGLEGWMWDGRRGRSLPSAAPDPDEGAEPLWPVAKVGGRFLPGLIQGMAGVTGSVGVPV